MASYTSKMLLLASCLGSYVAASPFKRQDNPPYTLTASTGQAINANSGNFWVDRCTTTGCDDECACSSFSNTTTIGVSNGAIYMAADVPGGQDVYVAANGALTFTEPHGEGDFPPGASTSGFAVTVVSGQPTLTWSGEPNVGWALCGDEGQVFALIDDQTACPEARQITINVEVASGNGAFEYE